MAKSLKRLIQKKGFNQDLTILKAEQAKQTFCLSNRAVAELLLNKKTQIHLEVTLKQFF